MREYNLALKWSKKITPNIMHLAFVREDGEAFSFTPGEFLTFLFDTAEGLKRRSYSVATIPGNSSEIEIAISYLQGGVASEALFNLKPGETIKASGPFGRLILKPDEPFKRYILVATGTGVAPYRAMLPEIAQRLHNDPDLKVVLLLGVQYRTDLLYGEDFIAFAAEHSRFDFRAYFSRDDLNEQKAYEHKGYVQTAFNELKVNPEEDVIYLCGNPNMIDAAFAQLTDEGFSPKHVRREKYISSN